jgi:hypothetical protein
VPSSTPSAACSPAPGATKAHRAESGRLEGLPGARRAPCLVSWQSPPSLGDDEGAAVRQACRPQRRRTSAAALGRGCGVARLGCSSPTGLPFPLSGYAFPVRRRIRPSEAFHLLSGVWYRTASRNASELNVRRQVRGEGVRFPKKGRTPGWGAALPTQGP